MKHNVTVTVLKRFALICFLVSLPALAFADAVAPPPGFEWLAFVLQFLNSIPFVGAILAKVFPILATVGVVMTYVALTVEGFLKLPEVIARFAGAPALADKIKAIADKVLPWLQWFSMLNAPKKP